MRKEINIPDKAIILLQRKADKIGISLKRYMERKLIQDGLDGYTTEQKEVSLEELIKLVSRKIKNK